MEALRRIADFAKVLRLDPLAVIAYIVRGFAYGKKGVYDQAIAEYDQALDLAVAYNNRNNRELACRLAVSLLTVLVFVLPFLGLALAFNNQGLAYLVVRLLIVLLVVLVFVLPLLGLEVASNNQGLAYHLVVPFLVVLLVGLLVALPSLGLAVAYNNQGPLLAVLAAVPLLVLAVAYNKRGLAVAAAYKVRGDAYEKKGDYDQAIADYDQAIRLKPGDATAYNSRGFAYHKQGKYNRAIIDYDQAIRLKPKDAAAYKVRGDAYEKKGDYDQAIADYDQAIQLDSKYVAAYNNRGFAYDNRGDEGDYCQATADYTKAIQLDSKYAVAYNNRGFAYWKQENYCQAIKDFTKTIQLKPDHATSYLNRGGLYQDVASVKFDKAVQVFAAGSDVEYEGAFDQVDQSKDAEAQAIEDYDNTVRLCPNYKTDFADGKFANGGQPAVDEAIRLLDRRIKAAVDEVGICISGGAAVYDKEVKDRMIAICHPKSATFFYYLGVRSLFENSLVNPWKYFVQAMALNYDDGDNGEKLARHLKNLNNDTERVAGCDSSISILSSVLGIDEERLRSILETLTQDRE